MRPERTERASRRAQAGVSNIMFLVIFVLLGIGVLAIIMGSMFPILKAFGIQVPGQFAADLSRQYLISSCNAWLDAGGLKASYPDQLMDAIIAAGVGWEPFCSPEAIKDPQKRCVCLKACTMAVSAEKQCGKSSNIFKPDLFTPDADNDKVGTVRTKLATLEDVPASVATSYCVIDRMMELADIQPVCRSDNLASELSAVILDAEVSYVSPNRVQLTCTAICNLEEGQQCVGVSLTPTYRCYSARGKTEYCCTRRFVQPVQEGSCLDPSSSECPYAEEGFAQLFNLFHKDRELLYENIRYYDGAKDCASIPAGGKCGMVFEIDVPEDQVGPPATDHGILGIQNYALGCQALYQGNYYKSLGNTALVSVGTYLHDTGESEYVITPSLPGSSLPSTPYESPVYEYRIAACVTGSPECEANLGSNSHFDDREVAC